MVDAHHTSHVSYLPPHPPLSEVQLTLTFLCLHCKHPFLDFLCCLLGIGMRGGVDDWEIISTEIEVGCMSCVESVER